MLLFSLAHNSKYIIPDDSGLLRANSAVPGNSSELLATNLSRPRSDFLWKDDRLLMRFTRTNNTFRLQDGVGRMARDRIYESPVMADRAQPDYITTVNLGDFKRWFPRHYDALSGEFIAPFGAAAPPDVVSSPEPFFVRVRDARRVSAPGLGNRIEVILGLEMPINGDPTTPLFHFRMDGDRVVGDTNESDWFRIEPHPIRAHFLTADDLYMVTEGGDAGLVQANRPRAYSWEAFTIINYDHPYDRRLFHGDAVLLRAWTGRYLVRGGDSGRLEATGQPDTDSRPLSLRLMREEGDGEVQEGDAVRFVGTGEWGDWALAPETAGEHRIALTDRASHARAVLRMHLRKPLQLQWHGADTDTASVATYTPSRRDGYRESRVQGHVYISPRPDTAPLKAFYSEERRDTLTTSTVIGEETALAQGSDYLGIQGYVLTEPHVGTIPLKQYHHAGRRDHFLAATRVGDGSAYHAGYEFSWLEGHLFAPEEEEEARVDDDDSSNLIEFPFEHRDVARHGIRTIINRREFTLPEEVTGRRRTALVLSGGGAKGCFEAGAVQALWNAGYRPDIICGVSVGALNAAKLAEGRRENADELVDIWESVAGVPGGIHLESHYTSVLVRLLERLLGRLGDTGIGGALGWITAAFLGAPLGPIERLLLEGGGAFSGLMMGLDLSELDDHSLMLLNMVLLLVHSQHSMKPTRGLIERHLDVERLAESDIMLQVGITDIKTGQYISVSQPWPQWTGDLGVCGFIECEPDHQQGDTWLTRPIYGTAGNVVRLADAIYASSALPVFMEPVVSDLREARVLTDAEGSTFTELQFRLPPGVQALLDATTDSRVVGGRVLPPDYTNVEEVLERIVESFPRNTRDSVRRAALQSLDGGHRGAQSWHQYLFDGGLRDTMPIRTAMRLGATDILVITGDRVQQKRHGYATTLRTGIDAPNVFNLDNMSFWQGVNVEATPAWQHLLGLLGVWFNEASRSDLLLSVAQGEHLGWLGKAAALMSDDQRRQFAEQLEAYRDEHWEDLLKGLGATSPIGGRHKVDAYGRPFGHGLRIRLIAPDRDIIDPLNFANEGDVLEGIDLGRRASRHPITLVDHT